MPLVRISLRQGTSPAYRQALSEGVHRAMVESLAIPSDDRFQVITECAPESLIYDPGYLGVQRSDRVVFVQITMSTGRRPQQKRRLFRRMAEILAGRPASARKTSSSISSRFPGRTPSETGRRTTWTRDLRRARTLRFPSLRAPAWCRFNRCGAPSS